jgi:hypothetical protein
MNIRVEIKLLDQYDREITGISETNNIDNEALEEQLTSEIEIVIDHIKKALRSVGFSNEIISIGISNNLIPDFEIICNECGGICEFIYSQKNNTIHIELCPYCKEQLEDKINDKGQTT